MRSLLFNLGLAMEGVLSNRFRAFLTALGIVFGVAAVIAMMSIGRGAEQAILEQMKLVGTNNIVITAIFSSGEGEGSDEEESADATKTQEKKNFSPGLRLSDLEAIATYIPTVDMYSPEVVLREEVIFKDRHKSANVVGATNDFFVINNLQVVKGDYFHDKHFEIGSPVCILGANAAKYFYPQTNPVGQKIKCGSNWLTVIGVLESRRSEEEDLERLGIRDLNNDIYIPIQTALIRFEDRSRIDPDDFGRRSDENENYHQLDKAVVHVSEPDYLRNTARVISRMLTRRHNDQVDFEIEIPELLIQQQQKTQETFNMVLAIIAGISLLVGGIGIMNIMLASVMERIREIGIRRSLGATRKDITLQFLLEAVIISLIGGLIGIVLGLGSARVIARSADIPTETDVVALVVSFFVAVAVGLIFGLFPAEKAAKQDPIKSLRTD